MFYYLLYDSFKGIHSAPFIPAYSLLAFLIAFNPFH